MDSTTNVPGLSGRIIETPSKKKVSLSLKIAGAYEKKKVPLTRVVIRNSDGKTTTMDIYYAALQGACKEVGITPPPKNSPEFILHNWLVDQFNQYGADGNKQLALMRVVLALEGKITLQNFMKKI